MIPTQIWGDTLPSDVVYVESPYTEGTRLPDGKIQCGCGASIDDNSSPGLKPSCHFCWRGINVKETSTN